jgi:hypothetical protein
MVILGATRQGIRQLEADDSEVVHELRREIEADDAWKQVLDCVAGRISYSDLVKTSLPSLLALIKKIIRRADLVCVTPARSDELNSPARNFKTKEAAGILIDEAANMTMADYMCVAGNCLAPCIMGGDPRQLEPTVMTQHEKDGLGQFYNRHVADGKLSPLTFFQASGIPVYRLRL